MAIGPNRALGSKIYFLGCKINYFLKASGATTNPLDLLWRETYGVPKDAT